MSRIGYRFYNDGDQLGIGYGKETCNPAAVSYTHLSSVSCDSASGSSSMVSSSAVLSGSNASSAPASAGSDHSGSGVDFFRRVGGIQRQPQGAFGLRCV